MFGKIMSWFHGPQLQVQAIKSNVITDKPIKLWMNDLSTPELIKEILPPTKYENVNYQVVGYAGGGFELQSKQNRSANVFATITHTLEMCKAFPVKKWAATKNLIAIPEAGEDYNAFYNRLSLQFFRGPNPVKNKMVYTADSHDIVAHEVGHAILDAYRPDLYSAASLEVWAFHEAFGDFIAMMAMLQHDEVIEMFLRQTEGDLRKPNIVAHLVEEFGGAVYDVTKGKGNRSDLWLRNAINTFRYVNPGTLPKEASDDKLAAECHSFGRIFIGAFYDIFESMYRHAIKHSTPVEAVKYARDTLLGYVLKAVQNVPLSMKFYEAIAKTMLWVDWTTEERPHHAAMRSIFLSEIL